MFMIIFIVVAALAVFFGPHLIRTNDPNRQRTYALIRNGIRYGGIAFLLLLVASTSFVFIGPDETGHRVRIYGSDLPEGRILALSGEKGPQAQIMPPGFHFEPMLNVLYDITAMPIVEIPDGGYGLLVARDGAPLRPNQTFADPFRPDVSALMIGDATYYLENGGQKGPQTTVLTPGRYRFNRYLWDVQIDKVTEIPEGFVGVVKSNVHSAVHFGNLATGRPTDCRATTERQREGDALSVPLVPVGCIGVWEKALNPGRYYINREAYRVTQFDTRVRTWTYKGGYRKRSIDLKVNQEGDIEQVESAENVPEPSDAADKAVSIVVEGWRVFQELRVLVQVTPDNAPFVVASVGGLEQVEDRILTPAIRSVLRNVVGGAIEVPEPVLDKSGQPVLDAQGRPVLETVERVTRVLDLIEQRDILEGNVERIIRPEALKAGVEIKEIRFGDPVIPPEILAARQRRQLAIQLRNAFVEERNAQAQRIETEQARATANQQSRLVEAQIEVQRSEQFAMARANEGRGERDKLNLIAEGQKAQAQVLGEGRVADLRKFEFVVGRLFDFFEENPQVLSMALANAHKFVPERVFTIGAGGEGAGSLAGAAGILGDFLGGSDRADPGAGGGR